MARGLASSSLACLVQGLTGRFDAAARAVLMMAHYSGRFAGLLGLRTARYVKKDKSAK